jgi:hypothetical protein
MRIRTDENCLVAFQQNQLRQEQEQQNNGIGLTRRQDHNLLRDHKLFRDHNPPHGRAKSKE